jgi:DNA-binding LacI/PurR family transcriptional regulator
MAATIAILVDELECGYQTGLVLHALEAARRRGARLLCFCGGSLGDPRPFRGNRNTVYDLVAPERIDGLIILANTIGNYVGRKELLAFMERYRGVPVVSCGLALPGYPSVTVDNASGLRAGLRHLIRDHGYSRLAFIGGPEINDEARIRRAAFERTLADEGLTADPSLFAPGDFNYASGVEAVRLLVDERKVAFDALVAANDTMVIGAMDALAARGIRIPAQVAVMGFDDVDEARVLVQPLTTVRQPIAQLADRCVEAVMECLAGREVKDETLATELVVRRSCGCRSIAVRAARDARERTGERRPAPVRSVDDALGLAHTLAFECIESISARDGASVRSDESTRRLVAALERALRRGDALIFAEALEEVLAQAALTTVDFTPWHRLLAELQEVVQPLFDADARRARSGDEMFREARMLVAEAAERARARQTLRISRWLRAISETGQALSTATDMSALMKALELEVQRLGVPSVYVALSVDGERPAATVRLELSAPLAASGPRTSYPSQDLLPRQMFGAGGLPDGVVMPLYVKDDQLGFAVFGFGPREGIAYELLREQISAAVAGLKIVDRLRARVRDQGA